MSVHFELVSKYKDEKELLPKRATKFSAGYDLKAAENVLVFPDKFQEKPVIVRTGVKVKLGRNEFMLVANRSSNPIKRNLVLANGVGIIDADYYGNSDNEGEILLAFYNRGHTSYQVKKGERLAQGIILPYGMAINDLATGKRTGGLGSTDR